MDRIEGSFPGGPRKRDEDEDGPDHSERAFARVEDLWRHTTARFLRTKHRSRLKRILWGFAITLVVAAGVGLYVGIQSHRTAEELAREQDARAQTIKGLDLEGERQKILQELWKMETLEKLPTGPTGGG